MTAFCLRHKYSDSPCPPMLITQITEQPFPRRFPGRQFISTYIITIFIHRILLLLQTNHLPKSINNGIYMRQQLMILLRNGYCVCLSPSLFLESKSLLFYFSIYYGSKILRSRVGKSALRNDVIAFRMSKPYAHFHVI